jgi:2-oxoacid:acceptor oxidoreductase delta subunit (pyruvate/2-ketoisovalerate family)
MSEKKKGWRDLPIGGMILEAGNSVEYNTGGWRTFRPIHNADKCTNCLLCWIYCPDSAIRVKDGKFLEFDLEHCKGCGICARECPDKVKAIDMVEEAR